MQTTSYTSPNPKYYAIAAVVFILFSMCLPVGVTVGGTPEPIYLNDCVALLWKGDGDFAPPWIGAAIVQLFIMVVYIGYLARWIRLPSIRTPLLMTLMYGLIRGGMDVWTLLRYRPPFDNSWTMLSASSGLASLASLACQILFVLFLYWRLTPPPTPTPKAEA